MTKNYNKLSDIDYKKKTGKQALYSFNIIKKIPKEDENVTVIETFIMRFGN